MAVARAGALGESNQAYAGTERLLCFARHLLHAGARAIFFIRHGHVAEAAHHPAIGGNFEMRGKLESAHELRNRRVDHEGIEDIHVIAHEKTRALRIESRRASHLEFHARQTQNVAKKNALRPVVFPRIKNRAKPDQQRAYDEKMCAAEGPQRRGTHLAVELPHTITSSAPGKISSRSHFNRRLSPSMVTFTAASRENSTSRTPQRDAIG